MPANEKPAAAKPVQAPKQATKPLPQAKPDKSAGTDGYYAVVRIRGPIGTTKAINDTMELLHMERNNSCVLIKKSPSADGMLRKIKDYAAFGEASEETVKALVEKRGEPYLGRLEDSKGKIQYHKFIEMSGKKLKPHFRLSPPKGGFERKGIKKSFSRGGALGYRGSEINKLIEKMM